MDRANWKHIAEIIGIAAIVASLVFVGLQIRQAEEVASIEMMNAAVERFREAKILMIENADIWQRGCANEELDSAEAIVFAQIINVNIASEYNGWRRLRISDFDDADPHFIIDRLAASIHRYPGYAAAVIRRNAWSQEGMRYQDSLRGEFNAALATRLEELRVIEPEPAFDTSLCGM